MRRYGKQLSAVVLLAAIALTLCCCGVTGQDTQNKPDLQTIEIPRITVDLQNPENRVEVPADVPSCVFDEEGRQLSNSQWLLNSKFSKTYIESLGAGSYTLIYESSTAKGTIHLTVTDSEKPNYVFAAEIPQTVAYLDAAFLPRLVKEQDSFQGDYAISYGLTCGETACELLEKPDGFQTEALEAGDYLWTAMLSKDGVEHTYTHSFHVQSFDEHLAESLDELILNDQTKQYLVAEDGKFTVSTAGNNDIFRYTVAQSIIDKAVAAGKRWIVLKIVTDKPYAADASGANKGSFWMTDSWNRYNIGCSSLSPFRMDRSGTDISSVVGMYAENGSYVYYMKGDLRLGCFTETTPLQYFFADGIQCQAEMILSFE